MRIDYNNGKRKRSGNNWTTPPKRHRGSPSSGPSTARRVLDFGLSNSPLGGYYKAAKGAYKIAKYLTPRRFGQPGPAVKRARMGKYHTTSVYKGKFKRKRIGKSSSDVYLRNGFKNTMEITGTVSDPDCVYVGHSTTSGHRILTVFLQAALRKLFKQSVNWRCTNVSDQIRGYLAGPSDGYTIELVTRNMDTGVETSSTYPTITNDSIYRIVGDTAVGVAPAFPNLYNFWVNYISSAGFAAAGSVDKPIWLRLYQNDGNATNFPQFCGSLYFPDESINLSVLSELKIQNRTLAATGSADAEDITNNPLTGRSYQFSTGAPRTKVDNIHILEGMIDASGAITRRAAEFILAPMVSSQIMKEPPEPKIFSNVVKSGRHLLQPGNIKKDVLMYRTRMQCHRFFEMLDWRPSSATIASAKQMKCLGKSALFAFEDLINVNLAQNISIAYEINRSEMCYLTTAKAQVAQGMFAQIAQSSIPP